MATFRYSHIYSEATGFTPSNTQLEKAEIGLQLAKGEEGLFFKNSANEVVKVGIGVSYTKEEADARYVATAVYETSGSTPEIVLKSASGDTLATIDATPFIKDGMIDEVVITAGTGANDGKQVLKIIWNSDSNKTVATEIPLNKIFDPDNYYTKTEVNDFVENLGKAVSGLTDDLETLSGDVNTHTANTAIHVGEGEKARWNEVSAKTDTTAFTQHANDTELHVTQEKQDAWDAKAEVSDVTAVDNKITAHTANDDIHVTKTEKDNWNDHITSTTVHVTSEDKTKWNAVDDKADKNKAFGKVAYDSTTHIITFTAVDGTTTVGTIDANDFIKDGLVEDVTVTDGTGLNEGKQVLKITFVGVKDPVELTLEEIFKPNNYYTKTEVDGMVTALSGAVDTVSGAVDTNTTNIQTISGEVTTLKNTIITAATAAYDSNELKATLTKGDNTAFIIDMLVKKDESGVLLKSDAGDKIILSGGTF